MRKPRVSVLITFYQQDKYMQKCICSALSMLKRSEVDGEVIVCVQNPSQNAKEIIHSFANEIRVFFTETRKDLIPLSNASKNRLLLLSKSKAEYAIFLDGDDWYIGDLKRAIQILNSSPEIGGGTFALCFK